MRNQGVASINVIYHDPILDGLRRFKTQQDRSYEYLREAADEARYETYDLSRFLDTPAERFINDYVIPTLTIASCFIPGTQGITIPRALAATCARVVPALESMAVSYGATQIYREVTKFFNEQFKDGKDAVKKPINSEPAPRIQSSKADADNYIKGLTDQKNLILNRGKTKDGYHYYEVMQKFEYKGIKFRRGEYISRDTKHHEIEHFRDENYHYGALDPVTGVLKPGSRVPGRTLKTK